ncbi:unnamed protein product [Trypanosoma congolense IL3000]|uniref:WGS project CAEQ00000000 data, annotated contig 1678 n=1 Tax=Trypanosoma congolense (strain IL3000) TaxID=1068625 RepID=F9W7Z0_TRYCI|nr:unnamed protein product [Trypanosoma congolense IL3000]
MGEHNLAKIPESITYRGNLNPFSVIQRVNHSFLHKNLYRRYGEDAGANCNMINWKTGILEKELEGPLLWGGGILTVGKGFDGEIKISKLVAGETESAKGEDGKAFWTASPTIIPHLNKTITAFQAFKDGSARTTQKLAEIEKIEKQIELCLSNETMEEGLAQSCFKTAVKLNAELHAENALLARYHNEKGSLPSEDSLILHQSVVNVCFFFTALL